MNENNIASSIFVILSLPGTTGPFINSSHTTAIQFIEVNEVY